MFKCSRVDARGLAWFVDRVMFFFDELNAVCVNADCCTSLGQCATPKLLLRLTRTLCPSVSDDVEVACILRQVRDLELARCNVELHETCSDGLDQLRCSLSYLDAQGVSRFRSMNKWWHKEASADGVCKLLGIAELPSTKSLHGHSLVKSGYISFFFRRRWLENGDGWKVEISPCTSLAMDFGVHTYLDLSANAIQGVTAILDGQGHFPITWGELEALALTVPLHRNADDKLLRLLVNAPSCGRDMMEIPLLGMLGHICFHSEGGTGVELYVVDVMSMIGRTMFGKIEFKLCDHLRNALVPDGSQPVIGQTDFVLYGDPMACPPIADEPIYQDEEYAGKAENKPSDAQDVPYGGNWVVLCGDPKACPPIGSEPLYQDGEYAGKVENTPDMFGYVCKGYRS